MDNIYINKQDLVKYKATYELFNKLFTKDLISIDDLISVIEDAYSEIDELQEKLEDLEQDIEDNYKPISKTEQYGVSERWFY